MTGGASGGSAALLAGRAGQAYARGDLAAARVDVLAALRLDPALPGAHHLLAMTEWGLGDGEAALAAFAAAAARAPGDAAVRNNQGNLLHAMGRGAAALDAYRAAVALRPDFADAWANLALAAAAVERFDEAAAAIARATALAPALARAWAAAVEIARAACDPDAAAAAADRLLALTPSDAAAVQVRGRIEADLGGDPAPWFARAERLAPGDRSLLLARVARAAVEEGVAGLAPLAAAVAADPGWIEGHRELAHLRAQLGEPEPDRSFAAAIRADPANPLLRYHHVSLLQTAGRHADMLAAIAAARGALAHDPGAGALLDQFEAIGRDETGDHEAAARLLAPYAGTADVTLGVAIVRNQLRRGRADEAARTAEALAANGGGRHAWAYLSTAWRLTGDPRRDWLDGDPRLIGTAELGDVDLAALTAHLRTLHAMRAQPIDQTLRGGTQTPGDILLRRDPLLRGLRASLQRAVEAHVARLPPPDPRHPTLAEPRGGARIVGGWSVRLGGGGFHVNHIHPQGWLSSAFYVALPPADDGDPRAGWLALGQPPAELGLDLPPLRMIEPKPGRLALFPSTMWHGTLPFPAGERLTVAFDVAPRRG